MRPGGPVTLNTTTDARRFLAEIVNLLRADQITALQANAFTSSIRQMHESLKLELRAGHALNLIADDPHKKAA